MKNNKWKGHIKTLILTLIITVFVGSGVYYVRMQYNMAKIKTIKTNMSMIELKTKENLDKQKAEGQEISYVGTKLSETDNEELVTDLINKNIINEEEKDKYYILTDDDLETLKCYNVSNEEKSYYLINYESNEIIITKGCMFNDNKVLYKYSEIKIEDEKNDTK